MIESDVQILFDKLVSCIYEQLGKVIRGYEASYASNNSILLNAKLRYKIRVSVRSGKLLVNYNDGHNRIYACVELCDPNFKDKFINTIKRIIMI